MPPVTAGPSLECRVARLAIVHLRVPRPALRADEFCPALAVGVERFHPLNAILVLGMYGWLLYRLGQKEHEEIVEAAPAAAPAGS